MIKYFLLAGVSIAITCAGFSQQITLKNIICVDSEMNGQLQFSIKNLSSQNVYFSEPDLTSSFIIFDDSNNVMEPKNKINPRRPVAMVGKNLSHIIGKEKELEVKVNTDIFSNYDLAKEKHYKIIFVYFSLAYKKYNGAVPLKGMFITNPANLVFVNCGIWKIHGN